MKTAITITIRKRSSGYRVAALAVDSLDHAWSIASILVRSPEYARCFAVATAWDGAELFSVGFTPAPAPAYAVPNYAPAMPAANPCTLPAAPRFTPDAYAPEVIDAEPSPYGLRLVPRRR